ncbi:expressed unknown protein [Seminavis robusta]|uniref:Methyltransferase FkbM domain-containing protein n=1 Tax=Seminavis robusta TaxID=568900 RepID=A0A9N8EQP1_9STRA|nr:expressed unknown protein [Seminavis robusta]|eukprot:Sro1620_g286510.1 n/a (384) ;mRNA; r:15079-16230
MPRPKAAKASNPKLSGASFSSSTFTIRGKEGRLLFFLLVVWAAVVQPWSFVRSLPPSSSTTSSTTSSTSANEPRSLLKSPSVSSSQSSASQQQQPASQESLFKRIAPLHFPMDMKTGTIQFPPDVTSVIIDIGARQSDYLGTLEVSPEESSIALILIDPLPESIVPLQHRAAYYAIQNSPGKKRTPEDPLDAQKRDRVFAIHAAMGPNEGTAEFQKAVAGSCGSLLPNTKTGVQAQSCIGTTGTMTVMVFPLKDLLDLIPTTTIKSIHLKVDAEGADLQVLKSAGDSLKKVSSVVIECQDLEPNDKRILRQGACLLSQAKEYMCQTQTFCNTKAEISGKENRMVNAFFTKQSTAATIHVPSFLQKSGIQFSKWYQSIAGVAVS